MVRISTIYDTDINKRVFLVRGDERYARSTSVVLSVGEYTSSTALGYIVPITVNVLRDMGSAKVVVYDNDHVINMIDWSENQPTAMTFNSPTLAWGTDHIITVKYMGNEQCSPSSATFTIESKINPNKYQTSLSFNNLTRLTYPNTTYQLRVNATCTELTLDGQDIEFYLDYEKIGTATIENGVATYSYSTTKTGLLNVEAKYNGGQNQYASSVSNTISSGLNVELTGLPSATTVGGTSYVEGVVYPYGDVTGSLSNITYIIYGYVGNSKYNIGSGTFDGYGTFQDKQITLDKAYDSIELNAIKSGKTFKSEKYPIQVYNITDIDFDYNPIVANNFLNTIRGTLQSQGGAINDVPIEVSGGHIDTVYTDTNGDFTYPLWGEGKGDVTLTFTISTDYASDYVQRQITIEDVMQYWDIQDREYNQEYTSVNARILKLTNGYKIDTIDSTDEGFIRIWVGSQLNYSVEYDQITGTGNRNRIQVGQVIYQGETEWTGTHIKYVRENGIGSFYINDVLEAQAPDDSLYFMFGVNMVYNSAWLHSMIIIDKFKLKRI